MKPTNNKSLLQFIFTQMEKLDSNEINVDQAKAQALFSKQANNSLKYELDRANTKMKLAQHNAIYKDGLDLREAEANNVEQ